jgi:hypothetical protein
LSVSIGLLQWKANLKSVLGAKPLWPAANAVSGILMGLIVAMIAHVFTNSDGVTTIPRESTLVFDLGVVALVGLAIGIPQWIVLRGYVHRASLWIVVNVLAPVAAIGLTAVPRALLNSLIIFDNDASRIEFDFLFVLSAYLGIPLVFGAITGTALFRLLQHRKQPSE